MPLSPVRGVEAGHRGVRARLRRVLRRSERSRSGSSTCSGRCSAAGHAYAAVVPAFVAAALAGEPVTVHGDGGQTRDFTYVGSVCEVDQRGRRGRRRSERPVNLAFGGRSSLLELLAELEAVLDRPVPVGYEESRPGDVRHRRRTTKPPIPLPQARPVPLRVGLERTVEWFVSNE